MRLPDFISLVIQVFQTNPPRTVTGNNSIRESAWHGIRQVPERHRFAQPTRLAIPTSRGLRVKIRPAPIPGVDAQRLRALRVDSRIRGKGFPAEIRSLTRLIKT